MHGARAIPARHDLGLPHASRHTAGTVDMVYDTRALVWVEKSPPIPVEDPAPPVMVRPISVPGPRWDVFDARGGFRLWSFTQPDFHHALEEKRRLCQGSGYRSGDAYLRIADRP